MHLRLPVLVFLLLGLLLPAPRLSAHSSEMRESQGAAAVALAFPIEGIAAQVATDLTFRVLETSRTDAGTPLPCITVGCRLSMPAMPGMPNMAPTVAHDLKTGDYAVHVTFPHGGLYRMAVTGTPQVGAPFRVAFLFNVGDPNKAAHPAYALHLETVPAVPIAGKPTHLTLRVVDSVSGNLVTAFDTFHEKKMHLIVVRNDLGQFSHVHPVIQPDGRFLLPFTFPSGGDWTLFADTAPTNAGEQVASARLTVSGPAGPAPAALSPAAPTSEDPGGMIVSLTPGARIAHQTRVLRLLVTDAHGQPVTDIQPWLAAPAHLTLIDAGCLAYIHAHPDQRGAAERNAGALTFLTRFPHAGPFKGWLQFRHANVVRTFAFVVQVDDPPAA